MGLFNKKQTKKNLMLYLLKFTSMDNFIYIYIGVCVFSLIFFVHI